MGSSLGFSRRHGEEVHARFYCAPVFNFFCDIYGRPLFIPPPPNILALAINIFMMAARRQPSKESKVDNYDDADTSTALISPPPPKGIPRPGAIARRIAADPPSPTPDPPLRATTTVVDQQRRWSWRTMISFHQTGWDGRHSPVLRQGVGRVAR